MTFVHTILILWHMTLIFLKPNNISIAWFNKNIMTKKNVHKTHQRHGLFAPIISWAKMLRYVTRVWIRLTLCSSISIQWLPALYSEWKCHKKKNNNNQDCPDKPLGSWWVFSLWCGWSSSWSAARPAAGGTSWLQLGSLYRRCCSSLKFPPPPSTNTHIKFYYN